MVAALGRDNLPMVAGFSFLLGQAGDKLVEMRLGQMINHLAGECIGKPDEAVSLGCRRIWRKVATACRHLIGSDVSCRPESR